MGRAFEYRRAAKEKRWASMSRIFPKLSKAITVAAKEGGTDPETNAKLRTAIANAKGQNMPKDNIAAAIKRAEGKDAADYTEVNYEGKGPHGVLVFVECATDNTTRTVANVKHYFSKAGGGIVPTGSLEFMFNRMAVFEFKKPEGMERDDLEMALIDGGLEELDNEEDKWYAYADYTSFGDMQKVFEDLEIEPDNASLKRFPTSPVEFTEDQMVDIDKMLERIDEDDDVQAVYTNVS